MRDKISIFLLIFVISISSTLYGNNLSTFDRLNIIDIINKYAHAVDEKDYDLFKTLFIEDVETKFVFDPTFFGGETIIIKGIDDYMEYIKESGSLFRSSQHLIGNLLITATDSSVKVKAISILAVIIKMILIVQYHYGVTMRPILKRLMAIGRLQDMIFIA